VLQRALRSPWKRQQQTSSTITLKGLFSLACASSSEAVGGFAVKEILHYFDGLRKSSFMTSHKKPPLRCWSWEPDLAARCWLMAGWVCEDGSCSCPALVKTGQNVLQFRTPTFVNFGLAQLLCEGNGKKLHKCCAEIPIWIREGPRALTKAKPCLDAIQWELATKARILPCGSNYMLRVDQLQQCFLNWAFVP